MKKKIMKPSKSIVFLKTISALSTEEYSFDEIMQKFLDSILDFCDWPVGHGSFWIQEENRFVPFSTWSKKNKITKKELKKCLDAGLNQHNNAIKLATGPDKKLLHTINIKQTRIDPKIKSAFSIYVNSNSSVLCVLDFWNTKKSDLSSETAAIIEIGATLVGKILGRLQTQSQLMHTEKMASLGEMAGGIAHEINTPLGAITLSISQLSELIPEKSEHEDDIKEIIQDVLESSEKISRIVRGLKNFSRESVDGGDFVFCDLIAVLNESIALCEMLLQNKGIQLIVNPLPKNLNMKCNPSQISQIIVNLISNARDAVQDLEKKWIELSLKDENDAIELRVTDSGPGIPDDIKAKLFVPFFTTKKIGSGTGLGLSIIHGIVKKHKGDIFVDPSRPNTSFVVKIPKFISE